MATRDLWHLGFARLIRQRAPPGFVVRAEVPLSDEPQRADLILIRREDGPRRDDQAELLRALWPFLSADTVLEFKSPVRGFRRNDLKRLASYGAQYHVLEDERLLRPSDLTLVLVVPSRNAALDDEIARMGWRLVLLDRGPRGGSAGARARSLAERKKPERDWRRERAPAHPAGASAGVGEDGAIAPITRTISRIVQTARRSPVQPISTMSPPGVVSNTAIEAIASWTLARHTTGLDPMSPRCLSCMCPASTSFGASSSTSSRAGALPTGR